MELCFRVTVPNILEQCCSPIFKGSDIQEDNDCLALKMKALQPFKMSGTIHPTRRNHFSNSKLWRIFKNFTDVLFLSIQHYVKKIKNIRQFFLTASHTMCLPMIIAGTAMPATRPIPTGAPTNVPSCQRIFFFRDHGFLPQNVQPDGLQEEKCAFEEHVMVPVVQMVEALCYKAEGRGFDSWRCHWHKPSECTMALRLTQPLAKISTRNI